MELIGNIKDKKEFKRMRGIRNEIAYELLDGQRAIFPSKRKYEWLESVLTIKQYPLGIDKNSVTYSIYVDNTINKEDNFLLPIVRIAKWDRLKELNAKRFKRWPEIQIIQHELTKLEQKKIDEFLKKLDSKISTLQFAVGGLITDRSDPTPIDINTGFRDLIIKRWNGCQTIDFYFGDSNNLNFELEETVRDLMNYIAEVCKTPIKKPYTERYNQNLKELYKPHDWVSLWDYKPPTLSSLEDSNQ